MRWQFIDPKNQLECAERAAVIAKIESWWRNLEGKTDQISALFSQKAQWDLPDWVAEHQARSIHACDIRVLTSRSQTWTRESNEPGNGYRLEAFPNVRGFSSLKSISPRNGWGFMTTGHRRRLNWILSVRICWKC